MVRTRLNSAVVIALLGIAPGLLAETVSQPAATSSDATVTTPAEETAPTAATPAQGAADSAAASTTQTQGDTLALPKPPAKPVKKRVARAPVKVEVDGMPGRGATMAEVEKRFGKPRQKLAPVGKPPITRWVYDNYTAYFEHQYVIHSVKEEAPPPAMSSEPVPATAPPAMESADTQSAPAQSSEMAEPAAHEQGADAPSAPATRE